MQAPAGFIVQLTFLDFDLEEAPGCIYDRVVVNTGNTDVRFCGPTANGLTLNSTGDMMELSFTSDFSVQKRGFSVSFRHGRFGRKSNRKQANKIHSVTLIDQTLCRLHFGLLIQHKLI